MNDESANVGGWCSVVVRIRADGAPASRRRDLSPQLARVDELIAKGVPARVAFRQMAREVEQPFDGFRSRRSA